MNKESKKVFSRIGLAITITAILIQVIQFIVVYATKHINPNLIETTWYNYFLITISFYLIGLPVFYLIVKPLPEYIPKEKRKFTIGKFIMIIVIGFAMAYLTNLITSIILVVISLITKNPILNPISDVINNSNWMWTLLFVGIIAPIIEEIMFRGIIINKLIGFGDTVAILTSAILFGLFHGNFSQCFYATALGLILGYLRTRSGSLKYSIILHMCVNIIGGVIAPNLVTGGISMGTLLFSIGILTIIVVGTVLFALNVTKIKLNKGPLQLEKGTVFKTTCLNFGMILYVVIMLAIMIYLLLA